MSAGAESGIPRPTGYTEFQTKLSGPEVKSVDSIHLAVQALKEKIARDEPHLKFYSMRAEHLVDGAGIKHITIYLGYEPKQQLAPPPNPRNLNEAPPTPIGARPTDVELGLPLGYKEQQFGRGT